MTPRDIDKLRAIGYDVEPEEGMGFMGSLAVYFTATKFLPRHFFHESETAWTAIKEHAQSSKGMKTTMADKVRWLGQHGLRVILDPPALDSPDWAAIADTVPDLKPVPGDDEVGWGESPEEAVDFLFWKVP